ncbi:MAG TPA: hypothetical protein VF487_09630 [Chitinophagaceae bacterium]
MTNEQAVKILNEQIDSLKWVNDNTHITWLTQTKSEIKKIFGSGSEESLFLIGFHLIDKFSKTPINTQLIYARTTMTDFLQRCIESINRDKPLKEPAPIIKYVDRIVEKEVIKEVIKEVPVYPPKANQFRIFINWLKRRDTLNLIGTIILVLGLPFGLGWLLAENKGEIKNIELNRENKQLREDTTSLGIKNRELLDSITVIFPFDIPKSKSDSNTKNDKSKERPDSVHQ